MISFLLCLAILIVGYFVYGKIVDNTFGPDDRETPAVRINDGVDYVVMPQWKLFLVQLLNIAGLGPIFGAMQGALWGPVVFLWITFGTIFAGGVHDYFSGMMSERNDGASIAEITGKYLGPVMQNVMRVFSVVLLIMVGTVFAVGPAGLIVELCHQSGASGVLTSLLFWLIIILVYYFIATFISIDAVIGKIYPIFGICLIIMAIGVIFGIFTNPAYTIPEIWDHFGSMHPSGTHIWSFMFITVACGAISGFHSTQSPLMARCMKSVLVLIAASIFLIIYGQLSRSGHQQQRTQFRTAHTAQIDMRVSGEETIVILIGSGPPAGIFIVFVVLRTHHVEGHYGHHSIGTDGSRIRGTEVSGTDKRIHIVRRMLLRSHRCREHSKGDDTESNQSFHNIVRICSLLVSEHATHAGVIACTLQSYCKRSAVTLQTTLQ